MKAKDLRHPFKWKEREVLLKDKVLYVPDHYEHYEKFHFPGWEGEPVFGNSNPVIVEYCSGNGGWIAKKAEECPSCNWVAVEKDFERMRKIWARGKRMGLTNLFVICGEGHNVTSHYFPNESITQIYINFPDPWPKTRHAKHRIIKPSFIEEISRILKNDGELMFVTDDPGYSEEMNSVMHKQESLECLHPDPFYTTEMKGFGTSFFEELWRQQGKVIRFHQYRKRGV